MEAEIERSAPRKDDYTPAPFGVADEEEKVTIPDAGLEEYRRVLGQAKEKYEMVKELYPGLPFAYWAPVEV